MLKATPFRLRDDETGQELTGVISNEGNGLSIHIDGYGTKTEAKGFPVYIDLFDGELSVKVWGDINQEDRTHSVSLEGAKEEKRAVYKAIEEQVRHYAKEGIEVSEDNMWQEIRSDLISCGFDKEDIEDGINTIDPRKLELEYYL